MKESLITMMKIFRYNPYKEFTKFIIKFTKKERKFCMMGIILNDFISYIMEKIGNFTA
jgi:hypothetical protein